MSTLERGKTQEPQSRLKDGSIIYPGGVIGASAKDIAEVNNSFAKDEQGLGKVGAAVGVAVAAAVGVGGYVATHQEAPPPPPISASASPTPDKTTIATPPTGKVEVSLSPSPSPSPEVRKDIPCVIFPQEICNSARRVKDPQTGYTYIGINLPPGVQTPIFAGTDGKYVGGKEQGNPFNGSIIQIKTPNNDYYLLRGSVNVSTNLDPNVKLGEQLGYAAQAQSVTTKSLGYDVVFTIIGPNPAGSGAGVVEEDKLQKLFSVK